MNRLTLPTTLAAIGLLFLVVGCVVQIRPDGGMRIDLPPFIQPTPPAAGAPMTTTVTMTATASITNTPVITGTVTPTPSLTTTATATLVATAPTAAAATVTTTATARATAPVTATATVTATLTTTRTPPVTPTGTVTVTTTATPATGTPATGTPATSTPLPGTPTRVPTTTPPPGTRTAAPTSGITPSPTVTATKAATPTPTRTATGTPTRAPTPTSATPPATATAVPSTLFLGSHQGYEADSTFYVVGEVINGGSFPVFNVKVIGSFYDAGGNLVGAQESVTDLARIGVELSSPFKLSIPSSGNISRYELTLVWDDVSIISYEDLSILSQETRTDGQLEVFGELRNDGSVTASNIVVVVTFYDETGAVVDVYQGAVSKPDVAPDETATYTIPIPNAELEYARFTVQAQGSLMLF